MWVSSGREYGFCSSVSLWLGQCIAVHHRGTETQRTSDSSSPIQNSEEPFLFYTWSLSSRDPHPLLPKRGFLISAMRPGIIWPANRQAFREYFFKTIKYKIYSVKEIAHLSAFSIYRLLLHALNTFSAFISSNLRLRFIFLSRASLIAAILHLLEYLLSHRKAPNRRQNTS